MRYTGAIAGMADEVKPASREGQVGRAMEALEKRLCILNEQAEMLETRLQPVIVAVPVDGGRRVHGECIDHCPLAEGAERLVMMGEHVTERLQRLLDTLCL